ncbi:DHA2 family multidrug resistance protein [Erythromicrobium ramosum]|uniref:DHA2 family efflux MFS transporter permease subunit n=1 Tax=Erythrobacter ramosus TaxID=35811 RepID=A0A6I4UNK2_9SPHN|nr:MDR family MFS transporter [Erythrobacter ramosus]MBB3775809.1 DHA2 family multidrug resistance protein [Erythrobacter ramosus]MXP39099.1 DHA2 family efflux MFS transporter permease subunit [Erythrobacter ramosus]
MASRAEPAAGIGQDRPSAPLDAPEVETGNYPLMIVGVMAASLLQILDTTIANVALPHMQSSLGATVDTITWVLTSYIIASAVALPITGWLADRIGARRLFIGSVAGFILASMLCGLAQNLEEMVAFRALQGMAGAFIAPLSQSFMLDATRPSRHPQIMAIWGMGIMIGPILGPILGGWLTETANWRWVFFVNLPVGIASLAILIAYLPKRPQRERRFDITGFLLLAVALASFQLLLDRGAQEDWLASAEIWTYLVLTLSATWMVVIHFAKAPGPMFERKLFADRNFAIALSFMVVIGIVMFAVMALLPPMLQNLFGYGVIDTGIVLMPRGVGILVSMQLSGLMMRRGIDARPVVASGFLICAFSLWQMAHWSLEVDEAHVIISGLLQGLGMGLVFIPLQVSAFATLSPAMRTDGSSLLNLFRSLGASAGIAWMTVLLARNIQTSHEDLGQHVTAATGSVVDFSTIDRFQAMGDTAITLIDAEVNRQAAMIAYVDDFWLMMWITLAAAPLAFLMRGNKGRAAGPIALSE